MPIRHPAIIACAVALLGAQDFEDRLPGEMPSGWQVAWGRPADDIIAITNHQPFAGTRCWLLDRPAASGDGQYGVATRLTGVAGDARLSLALRLDGPGTATPGIELRAADGRRTLTRIVFAADGRAVRIGETVIGHTRDGAWLRLVLDWPLAGGEGRASLGPATGPASPQRVTLPPRTADVLFMVCVHAKGFTLRLDDLTWRNAAD